MVGVISNLSTLHQCLFWAVASIHPVDGRRWSMRNAYSDHVWIPSASRPHQIQIRPVGIIAGTSTPVYRVMVPGYIKYYVIRRSTVKTTEYKLLLSTVYPSMGVENRNGRSTSMICTVVWHTVVCVYVSHTVLVPAFDLLPSTAIRHLQNCQFKQHHNIFVCRILRVFQRLVAGLTLGDPCILAVQCTRTIGRSAWY